MTFLHHLYPTSVLFYVAFVALGMVAFGVVMVSARRESPRFRLAITGLRVAGIALVALMLLRPAIVSTQERVQQPQIGVLLDTSGSMALPGEDTASRFETYRRWIADSDALERLAQEAEVPILTFDERASVVPSADRVGPADSAARLETLEPAGATDLLAALRSVRTAGLSQPLDALVLLSDGRDTSAGTLLAASRKAIAGGRRVYPVLLPESAAIADVAIVDAQAPRFAYTEEQVTMSIVLRRTAQGPATGDLVLRTLEETGTGLAAGENEVAIEYAFAGEALQTVVEATFTSETPGHRLYELALAPNGDDLSEQNNRLQMSTVFYDTSRPVVVVGRPGWTYRFVRRALESDATFEVQSFPVITKSWTEFEESNAALGTALNEAELVVIAGLHPTEPSREWLEGLMPLIEDRGAGLLWLVGNHERIIPEHFQARSEFLPVEVNTREWSLVERTKAGLPEEGALASYLALQPLREESAASWRALPSVGAHFAGMEPGGAGTATLVDARTGAPLVIDARQGAGRVGVVLAGESWRWAFGDEEGMSDGTSFYLRFAHYLMRSETGGRLRRLQPTRKQLAGEEIALRARVTATDGSSDNRSEALIALDGPLAEGDVPQTIGPLPMAVETDGERRFRTGELAPGIYRVTLSLPSDPEVEDETTYLLVEANRREALELEQDREALQTLAEASGGQAISWSERETLADLLRMDAKRVTITEEREIWDTLPMMLLFAGILGLEWYLRKRKGLR